MNWTLYHYTVEEWRYRQPTDSEKCIHFWASPRNSSPLPLSLTVVCTDKEHYQGMPLGSASLINNLEQYAVEDQHEGSISVSKDYFGDIQSALFATSRTEGVTLCLELATSDACLDNAQINRFEFEIIAE